MYTAGLQQMLDEVFDQALVYHGFTVRVPDETHQPDDQLPSPAAGG